jgi:hypothetical protein
MPRFPHTTNNRGVIGLMTVIVLGAIVLAVGLAAAYSHQTDLLLARHSDQSQYARNLAESCLNEALIRLKRDDAYEGLIPAPTLESGTVMVSDSLDWTSIQLAAAYSNPPVILVTPATDNNSIAQGDGYYPIPLVRNVTTSGFDLSMCVDGGSETCTTSALAEELHWFAFDVDDDADYDWIEVGTSAGVATNGSDSAEAFSTSFANVPAIWTQAQTYSQGGEIGAVAWVDDITTGGFNYVGCVHTSVGDTCDTDNPDETFGYVAIDLANEAVDAAVGFQAGSANVANSQWTAAGFTPNLTAPRVMVTQNDDNGGQDPQYAWARNVTSTGMQFRYCEADAGNVCNTHLDELTYWFALEQGTISQLPVTDSRGCVVVVRGTGDQRVIRARAADGDSGKTLEVLAERRNNTAALAETWYVTGWQEVD